MKRKSEIKIEASLVNQIYSILKERIVNLELKLGQKIDIKKLAEELRVSQTPIRDVLNRLAKDDLVTLIPRRGYYVVELSAKRMEEIYDLRKIFECYALESAIESINSNKLRELKQTAERLQNEANESKKRAKFNESDRQLHLLIVQNSPNERLHKMYFQIHDFVKISQRMNPEFERSLSEHILLLEAMLGKNLTKAKEILRMHIDNARDDGIKALKEGVY